MKMKRHGWIYFAIAATVTLTGCRKDINNCESDSRTGPSYTLGKNQALSDNSTDFSRGEQDGLALTRDDGVREGYAKGKQEGYKQGWDSPDGYKKGWDDPSGYAQGLSDGIRDPDAVNQGSADGTNAGKKDGQEAGMHDGWTKGYADGYAAGKQVAAFTSCGANTTGCGTAAGKTKAKWLQEQKDRCYSTGYSEGRDTQSYANGRQRGMDNNQNGYKDGFAQGYASGKTDGYALGMTEGFEAGKKAGYQAGYAEALKEAYKNAFDASYHIAYTPAYTDGYNHITYGYGKAPDSSSVCSGSGGYGGGFMDGYFSICPMPGKMAPVAPPAISNGLAKARAWVDPFLLGRHVIKSATLSRLDVWRVSTAGKLGSELKSINEGSCEMSFGVSCKTRPF